MVYLTGTPGIASTSNSSNSLSGTAFCDRTNTAQAGTTSTITLDASASASDDAYNNQVIQIVDGTGTGQVAQITDYVGSTKVASAVFDTAPDSTSVFVIHSHSGVCQVQNQTNKFQTIRLGSNASSSDDFYNGAHLYIFKGQSQSHLFKIIDYNGATQVATIDLEVHETVGTDSIYAIFGEGGTAASATSTTIVLEASQGHSSTDDDYNGMIIEILSGTGTRQTRTITDYTGATRTATVAAWTTTPDSASVYLIYGGYVGAFEEAVAYSEATVMMVPTGVNHVIINQQNAIGATGTNIQDRVSVYTPQIDADTQVDTIISDYFRLKLISMGTAIAGSVQTILHPSKSGQVTTLLTEQLHGQHKCTVTRAVLTGNLGPDTYRNVGVSMSGNLKASIENPTSSFGEVLTAQLKPVAVNSFVYNTSSVLSDVDNGTVLGMITEGNGSTAQVQTITVPQASKFTSSGAGNYFRLTAGGGGGF